VADLGPLNGSRVSYLNVANTQVRDLSAVRRMPGLRALHITGCPVEDLEPLVGTSVHQLWLSIPAERAGAVLRRMPGLQSVNGKPAAEFLRAKP
jgi:Leucine-rich repeat (LRR) protein